MHDVIYRSSNPFEVIYIQHSNGWMNERTNKWMDARLNDIYIRVVHNTKDVFQWSSVKYIENCKLITFLALVIRRLNTLIALLCIWPTFFSLQLAAFEFFNTIHIVAGRSIHASDIITRSGTWHHPLSIPVKSRPNVLIVTRLVGISSSTRFTAPRMLNVVQIITAWTVKSGQIISWWAQVPITTSINIIKIKINPNKIFVSLAHDATVENGEKATKLTAKMTFLILTEH